MAFTAGGPNRRSLRERIRDGISVQIPFQAKSRSVDQSFHLNNPFADLDIISRVTTSHNTSGNGGGGAKREDSTSSNSQSATPTTSSPLKQSNMKKQETISYTVKENDTITSVSASFDITPSELIKTNRLSTRTIFPGQVLRIPPKTKMSTPNNSPVKIHNVRRGTGNEQIGGGNESDVGGAATGGNYSSSATKAETSRKFIKINVKHITDGNGVVSGTLLVTPNAVMFDPNVSDPLVIDQGAETYGVILPLEIIVHAGIYSDIAFMKVKGKDFTPPGPKPDLYPHDSTLEQSKEETTSTTMTTSTATATTTTTTTTNTNQSQIGESTNNESNFKYPQPEKSTESGTAGTATETETGTTGVQEKELEIIHDSGFETGRPSPALPNEVGSIPGEQLPEESRKQKVLKRLSFPLAWMESLGGQQAKEETQSAPPESKINYRSLVSLEDMPDLFASFDKLMPKQAGSNREHEDYPPWYLCLSMGKPKLRKIKSLIVSYGQKKSIKPEYWFSIPKNQVDDLYKFWMLWWPHLYGELDPAMVEERGYELVDWDTDLFTAAGENELHEDDKADDSNSTFDSIAMKGEQLGELTKESWEVVSMSEELRRALYGSEEFTPELLGESEILEEEDIKNLGKSLTARAEGYPWLLAFSTSRDGFSLNSLYRKMQGVESPVLILVEDTKQRVFGALVSCALHVSDHFYGTGQSFLFTCRPNFHVFKWTGENMYFIKGNYESLSVGAGDGKFGLWLDGDLFVGRTEECSTYGNTPLVEENDFVIKTLECWVFGRP